MQWFVARRVAMVILVFTQAHVLEYGACHLSASFLASSFTKAFASGAIIPSVDMTKGTKFRLFWRQLFRCFLFLAFSCLSKTFLGDRFLRM